MVTVFILVMFSSPTFAQLQKGNGELGLDFGYTNFDSQASDDDGWRFNVRTGYFLTDFFEIEGQLGGSLESGGGITTTLAGFFVNGTFNFRTSKTIVPYLFIGVGYTVLEFTSDFETDFKIDDSSIGYQGGIGTRLFLGEKKRAGIRVEMSSIREDSFDNDKTYTSVVAGYTIRLGQGAETPRP